MDTLMIGCPACGATNRVPADKVAEGRAPVCGKCKAPLPVGKPYPVTDATFAQDVEDPYTEAQLRGRVVEFRPDPSYATKDVTARKYTGKEFPWRYPGSVTLVIEVGRAKFTKIPFTHAPAGASR